jgi:mannose-6-phosphate isomerase
MAKPQQLRQAGEDGSIDGLVEWHAVSRGDSISVPAGTIHAIGAGLVIAEIQQRSDATFRLFDYGRQRELDLENAIAVADTSPAEFRVMPAKLGEARTLLISNRHFQFERIDLAPNTEWCLEAQRETWLLVIEGSARTGSFDVVKGDVVFAQTDRVDIRAGAVGMTGLVAYTGDVVVPDLLQRSGQTKRPAEGGPREAQTPAILLGTMVSPPGERKETIQ